MNIGTKSLLYGYHQILLHPLGVALSWWKLYGFPWDPRLWIAFFVHDLGYWGKPNMDGPEGENHPYLGARVMRWLFDRKLRFAESVTGYPPGTCSPWFNFTLYHSRFLAAKHLHRHSKLCVADKYLILLIPAWLQVLMTSTTGEIKEYRLGLNGRTSGQDLTNRQWVEAMKAKIREWMKENGPALCGTTTPEDEASQAEGRDVSRWALALVLVLCALSLPGIWWSLLKTWWTWKRVCAWCQPMRRMGGAPWARNVTHGMCPECLERNFMEPLRAEGADFNRSKRS